jgi:hypothetical protein
MHYGQNHMNGFDRLRTTSKLYYLRGNAFVRRRNQGKNNQDNNCPNTFPVVFPIYYLRQKKHDRICTVVSTYISGELSRSILLFYQIPREYLSRPRKLLIADLNRNAQIRRLHERSHRSSGNCWNQLLIGFPEKRRNKVANGGNTFPCRVDHDIQNFWFFRTSLTR